MRHAEFVRNIKIPADTTGSAAAVGTLILS